MWIFSFQELYSDIVDIFHEYLQITTTIEVFRSLIYSRIWTMKLAENFWCGMTTNYEDLTNHPEVDKTSIYFF